MRREGFRRRIAFQELVELGINDLGPAADRYDAMLAVKLWRGPGYRKACRILRRAGREIGRGLFCALRPRPTLGPPLTVALPIKAA
jgi:hypothetical protein